MTLSSPVFKKHKRNIQEYFKLQQSLFFLTIPPLSHYFLSLVKRLLHCKLVLDLLHFLVQWLIYLLLVRSVSLVLRVPHTPPVCGLYKTLYRSSEYVSVSYSFTILHSSPSITPGLVQGRSYKPKQETRPSVTSQSVSSLYCAERRMFLQTPTTHLLSTVSPSPPSFLWSTLWHPC